MELEPENPAETSSPREIVIRRIFTFQIVIIISIVAFNILAYMLELMAEKWGWQEGRWTPGFDFVFLLVGCMGASVSLLRRVEAGKVQLTPRTARLYMTTFMPILYGGVMAMVAYFLFVGRPLRR